MGEESPLFDSGSFSLCSRLHPFRRVLLPHLEKKKHEGPTLLLPSYHLHTYQLVSGREGGYVFN